MQEEKFSDKKTLISEYNEASFQILRLHNLWLDYNNYAREKQSYYMERTLDSIWTELFADAMNKDEEKYSALIERLNTHINESRNDKEKHLGILGYKATFLKKLQENVGKGSKKQKQYERM